MSSSAVDMSQFRLSVVAPDRTVVEEEVQSLVAPGHDGYLGVMKGHIPLIVALKPGLLEYRDLNGERETVAIGGGFMEVDGEHVTVLADQAERARDIDLRQAEEMLDRARRALRGEDSSMTSDEAAKEIEIALNRIKAARGS